MMAAETAIADQYAAAMINSGQEQPHRFQDSYRNAAVGGHHSVNIPANQAPKTPQNYNYDKVRNSYQQPPYNSSDMQVSSSFNAQKSPKVGQYKQIKVQGMSNSQY